MQYTVVHSTDPYLLARLATDLQMSGIQKRYEDNEYDIQYPFQKTSNMAWCDIDDVDFNFQNHDCQLCKIRYELTEENYIKTLTKILEL